MSVDSILPRLDGVRENGPGKWIAKCPAHEDRSPSLAIRADGDRILVHCFAGCSAIEVMGAIGLGLKDLYSAPLAPQERRSRAIGHNLRDVDAALSHEALVLLMALGDRERERVLEPSEREIHAAKRLTHLFRRRYGAEVAHA